MPVNNRLFNRENISWFAFLFLIFLFEFLLFRTYVLREIVGHYPTNHDQGRYLAESYYTYEMLLTNNLWKELIHSLFTPKEMCVLFPVQAAVFWLFTGASRFNALLLNFIYFVLLQISLVAVLQSLSKRWEISLIGLGLLLGISTTFFWAGGLMDFRLDFMAFCLFGIFISAILKSEIFLSRKYSLIAGGIAGLLILLRYLTTVYLALIFGTYITFLFLMKWRARSSPSQIAKVRSRIKNAFWSGSVVTMVAFPFLFTSRKAIFDYYFVGHILGPEKQIRALQLGVHNLSSNLLYYPKSILFDHMGLGNLLVISLVLIIGLALYSTRSKRISATESLDFFGEGLIFLVLCILVPLFALTLDTSKSPVVGNIVVSPLLWLAMWVFLFFALKIRLDQQRVNRMLLPLVVAVLVYGMGNQITHFGKHSGLRYQDNIGQVMTMYEDIGSFCETMRYREPHLSVDRIYPFFGPSQLSTIYYEKKGVFLDARGELGGSIFAINEEEALKKLRNSHVVIFSEGSTPPSLFPFDTSMANIQSSLRKVAASEFILLNEYRFDQKEFQVYVRPDFLVTGTSGDWITAEGIILSIPGRIARRSSVLVLEGDANFNWITPKVKPFAEIMNQDFFSPNLNVKITVTDGHYLIYCSIPPSQLKDNEVLRVKLTFSDYFIPKELKINEDTRKLVLMAPKSKKVILSPSP